MEKVKVKSKKAKPQVKSKNFEFNAAIPILALCVLSFLGCAGLKETAKCTWGVSTQLLEDGRKEAICKTFNYDYKTCYAKAREALGRSTSYIYAEDAKKGMIAVYVSEVDTTAVGIFCQSVDANNTEVQVASPSTWAKETIAKRLFFALDKTPETGIQKGTADAEEKMGDK